MRIRDQITVAVVQAASVVMDREQSVTKACRFLDEAADKGADLIVFPEAFIPGYPRGLAFGSMVGERRPEGRADWGRYWRSAISIPSTDVDRLAEAIARTHAYVVMGVIERADHGGRGTLYGTTLYFGPDGTLLGRHRKLKPTGSERLIWGEGIPTPFGILGGLICWENYMPLARSAMYAKGVTLYVAPTADARDTWQATLQHIACEGRCFVIGANQYVTRQDYPKDLAGARDLIDAPEELCRGGSAILNPLGHYVAGPLYHQEGLLVAALDLTQIEEARFDFDVTGHYARPDVFTLWVNETPQRNVVFHDVANGGPSGAKAATPGSLPISDTE